jgi:hypothetical protein
VNFVTNYCTEFIVVAEEDRENSEESFCLIHQEGQYEGQHATYAYGVGMASGFTLISNSCTSFRYMCYVLASRWTESY